MRYKDNANENSDLNAIAKEIDMKTAAQNASAPATPSVQAIEDMLDDLELDSLDAGDSNEVIEDVEELELNAEPAIVEPVTDDELEASVDIEELDLELERTKTYSSQESDVSPVENAQAAVKSAKDKPGRAPKAAKAPKAAATPRTPRDLNALDPSTFVLSGDVATMDQAALDQAKTDALAKVPTQKKIAEKYENLFMSLAANRQPSVYVKQALALIDEKKTVTGADITAMFKGSYGQGTAQSQAGQIMVLFDAVGIAERTKNTLTLKPDSVVAQKLRSIYANAGAAGA